MQVENNCWIYQVLKPSVLQWSAELLCMLAFPSFVTSLLISQQTDQRSLLFLTLYLFSLQSQCQNFSSQTSSNTHNFIYNTELAPLLSKIICCCDKTRKDEICLWYKITLTLFHCSCLELWGTIFTYYTMLLYHKLKSFVYHQIFPGFSGTKLSEIFRPLNIKAFSIK